ncbi:SRPBCC family protein [Streptomyces sp. NPDC001002]
MRIDNKFTVDAPIDHAWEVLTDLEGIAPCMPGAELTGVDGGVYSGKVKIKVGPVISQYAGTAEFVQKDEAEHRAVIRAKGKDSRGAGNASAVIDARLTAEGDVTTVTVETDLNITGKIAQFGSGMIKEVSEKLLGQFVKNLETQLHTTPEAPISAAAPANSSKEEEQRQGQKQEQKEEQTTVTAPAAHTTAPVDLLDLAGSSVYRRLIPVLVVLVVVIGIVVYFLAR